MNKSKKLASLVVCCLVVLFIAQIANNDMDRVVLDENLNNGSIYIELQADTPIKLIYPSGKSEIIEYNIKPKNDSFYHSTVSLTKIYKSLHTRADITICADIYSNGQTAAIQRTWSDIESFLCKVEEESLEVVPPSISNNNKLGLSTTGSVNYRLPINTAMDWTYHYNFELLINPLNQEKAYINIKEIKGEESMLSTIIMLLYTFIGSILDMAIKILLIILLVYVIKIMKRKDIK